jgi:hypothetical protein
MITMTWGFAAGPGTAGGALLDGAVAVRGAFGREELGGGGGALEIVVGGAGFGAVDDAGSGAEEDEDRRAGAEGRDGKGPRASFFWPVEVAK